MKKIISLLVLFITLNLYSQENCSIRISLITCTPGDELYSTFGHSAFRVADSSNGMDIIFNYGTFDFDDPDFYKKFVQGKLLYFVSIDSIQNFLREYEYFNRGVTEQVLNIDCDTKNKLVAALFENSKEENKYYLYDFTYDNCTTRLRDMLEKASGLPLQTKNILPSNNTTFRKLIHEYLNKGGQYWSKLGIDILLGAPLDNKVSNREGMFLPDYLMKAFDSASFKGQSLVSEKNILLPAPSSPGTKSWFTPTVAFTILLLIILFISIKWQDSSFLRAFDIFFFSICGLIGILILYMWFGTNHVMCRNNLNLLWALPTHFPMALMLFTKRPGVARYFKFVYVYSIILFAICFFLPQHFNIALLPVMGIILVRSYSISRHLWKKR